MNRQNKWITGSDFYKQYPYPCWDINKSTIPIPYIPKDKLKCEHKRALTFKQYNQILKYYTLHLMSYLLEGMRIKLPYWLGCIQFKKARKQRNNNVDFGHYQKTGEIKYHLNRHTLGYKPVFKWMRNNKEARLYNKYMWTIRFVDKMKKRLSRTYLDDGTKINKLIDS